jgi:hypothetical protein
MKHRKNLASTGSTSNLNTATGSSRAQPPITLNRRPKPAGSSDPNKSKNSVQNFAILKSNASRNSYRVRSNSPENDQSKLTNIIEETKKGHIGRNHSITQLSNFINNVKEKDRGLKPSSTQQNLRKRMNYGGNVNTTSEVFRRNL